MAGGDWYSQTCAGLWSFREFDEIDDGLLEWQMEQSFHWAQFIHTHQILLRVQSIDFAARLLLPGQRYDFNRRRLLRRSVVAEQNVHLRPLLIAPGADCDVRSPTATGFEHQRCFPQQVEGFEGVERLVGRAVDRE